MGNIPRPVIIGKEFPRVIMAFFAKSKPDSGSIDGRPFLAPPGGRIGRSMRSFWRERGLAPASSCERL